MIQLAVSPRECQLILAVERDARDVHRRPNVAERDELRRWGLPSATSNLLGVKAFFRPSYALLANDGPHSRWPLWSSTSCSQTARRRALGFFWFTTLTTGSISTS